MQPDDIVFVKAYVQKFLGIYTRYKDILDVRTMQLETKHCNLTVVVFLSKDNSV